MDLFVLKIWVTARFGSKERGASMVEYALLLAFIAVICVVAVKALGENVSARFSSTSASLN